MVTRSEVGDDFFELNRGNALFASLTSLTFGNN
jgi:hypothetical protein